MRLATDGSSLPLNDTSAINMSTIWNFGEGSVALGDAAAFGCDKRLTSNCVLANGTANFNCSTICSTPSLLFENYYTCEYCAPNNDYTLHNGITRDAADAVIPLINACMQQYCAAPFDGLGGCPWTDFDHWHRLLGRYLRQRQDHS